MNAPRTLAQATEERVQVALIVIRHDMRTWGLSKKVAIARYLEHSTFGPALVARLEAEA